MKDLTVGMRLPPCVGRQPPPRLATVDPWSGGGWGGGGGGRGSPTRQRARGSTAAPATFGGGGRGMWSPNGVRPPPFLSCSTQQQSHGAAMRHAHQMGPTQPRIVYRCGRPMPPKVGRLEAVSGGKGRSAPWPRVGTDPNFDSRRSTTLNPFPPARGWLPPRRASPPPTSRMTPGQPQGKDSPAGKKTIGARALSRPARHRHAGVGRPAQPCTRPLTQPTAGRRVSNWLGSRRRRKSGRGSRPPTLEWRA